MTSTDFLANLTPEPTTGCWLWNGPVYHGFGYGMLWFDGKSAMSHRVSWLIHKGSIPEKMCICHKCDVPECCNPNHLFIGTKSDNARDRDTKRRHRACRGERHHRATLSDHQVGQAILLRRRGVSFAEIARRMGVASQTIQRYCNGTRRQVKAL